SYRSQTSFNAKGTATAVRNTTGGTITNLRLGDTWISNVFPHQISLGAFFKLSDLWKVSPEYSFTNYSENKFLGISGGVASTIAQNWKNQHIGRLGFEYLGMGIPLRFGYAYTSQVTPSDHARSSFASPGSGHAIAAGSGMSLGTIDFDFAGEYSFASGS